MAQPEPIRIELPGGAAIEWDPAVLPSLDGPASSPWTLRGAVDWGRFESIRVVTADLGDSTLALVALRPAGAAGHGQEATTAVLSREGAAAESITEALLSTEYGPDGEARRIGIELWPEDGPPERIVADRVSEPAGEPAHRTTAMSFRGAGGAGGGLYELVTDG